jgi:hypothetical protein
MFMNMWNNFGWDLITYFCYHVEEYSGTVNGKFLIVWGSYKSVRNIMYRENRYGTKGIISSKPYCVRLVIEHNAAKYRVYQKWRRIFGAYMNRL